MYNVVLLSLLSLIKRKNFIQDDHLWPIVAVVFLTSLSSSLSLKQASLPSN